jgi:DNA-binding XRE family transcriptional regulator
MARNTIHWTLRIATEPWEAKRRLEGEYKRSGYNVTKMAKRLGIARQTIYNYFRHLDIKPPEPPKLPAVRFDVSPAAA